MKNETRKIFVTAEFPLELERKARVLAASKGLSRSELIRLAVSSYLDKDCNGRGVTTNGNKTC